MTGPQWARIPAELRARPQWLVAGPDKAPMSIDAQGRTYNASVTDPGTWLTFAAAANYAYEHGLHIGYVLSAEDPFACIDLDVCDADSQKRKGKAVDPEKWTSAQQFDWYWSITQSVDSYAETSTYGKGLHIWVLGNIGHGCRRDGVEVYSQERFIVCTGNVVLDRPLADRQELLTNMVSQMRGAEVQNLPELVEVEEDKTDEDVIEMACGASNADKFNDLCCGRWEQYGFPSQSEADLALMSMFTFYSKSNEQCRRLFRMTSLGKRQKAVKNDKYLNFTLTLIRGRQAREAEVEIDAIAQGKALVAELNAHAVQRQGSPLHVVGNPDRVMPAPGPAVAALAGPTPPAVAEANPDGIQWPPGLAGQLAWYIYQSAPRPVKEVAIVGALGFLAGVCGKAFSIPQSGLNVYIILVARSAVGKEAMHSGISGIIKSAAMRCPTVYSYVSFADFASGPALTKECAVNQSFVNVAGEFGRKLKRIAQDDGREGPMSSLRTVMTNLYQKSGPQAIVGGMQYSNADKNVQSVSGVAFSLIGESTPGTFYECLTETMMEDGFLSRFTVVEYEGDRPPLNTQQMIDAPKALGDAVGELCQQVKMILGTSNRNVPVGRTDSAAQIMWAFEQECDGQINGTLDESWRQMWNRASLKVMRIAGLLAVADNWLHPVVDKQHVDWALDLIRRDIAIMRRRIEGGDVGTGDHSRERKVAAVIEAYLKDGAAEGYGVPAKMRENAVIPRKFLQMRTQRISSFTSHKLGSTAALDMVLRSMVDSGYLVEVKKDVLVEAYAFHGKAYTVVSLPNQRADRK